MQEELAGGLAAIMPAVNPVFFGIVGASVRVVNLTCSTRSPLKTVAEFDLAAHCRDHLVTRML